jgi:hypothetical protein
VIPWSALLNEAMLAHGMGRGNGTGLGMVDQFPVRRKSGLRAFAEHLITPIMGPDVDEPHVRQATCIHPAATWGKEELEGLGGEVVVDRRV